MYTPPDDIFALIEVERKRNTMNGKIEVDGFSLESRCRPNVCFSDDPKPCGVYTDSAEKNFYFDPEKAANGECCFRTEVDAFPGLTVCTEAQLAGGDQCGEICRPGVCLPESESCLSSDCIVC